MATIFDGMDQVVDAYLNLDDSWKGEAPRYKHKRTLQKLTETSPPFLSTDNLIDRLFKCSQVAWESFPKEQRRSRSTENWRFAIQSLEGKNTTDPEVVLERLLAVVLDKNWSNQIPVDSGLLGKISQKTSKLVHRGKAIDLIHRQADQFSIIELKFESNTPLYAAIQVIKYGVAYLFYRQFVLPGYLKERGNDLCPPIMKANSIDLVVLAPFKFYEPFIPTSSSSSWLEQFKRQINAEFGASNVRKAVGIPMTFQFEAFPREFNWSLEMASDQSQHELVKQALKGRSRVFAG